MSMLFMVMHKLTPEIEEGLPPNTRVISEMGQLIAEAIEQGKFQHGAGLKRSAERVRLRWQAGQCEVTRAPKGEHELLAGFAQLKVKSMDEAIAWTKRIVDAEGATDAEFDIGPVVERWDLGLAPKPTGEVPLHVLLLRKADAASERGEHPSATAAARMQTLLGEMQQAGVLLVAEGLKPSSSGARLRAASGKHSWTDGPFAESKEMISGFSIIKVDSLAEAKAWTERYADVLGDIEVDVREVMVSAR
jgi:hypothetical protein